MKEIPVTINVTAEDVDAFSHIIEMESEGSFLKLFSERFLISARNSSEEIKTVLEAVDSFNPYCMEKNFTDRVGEDGNAEFQKIPEYAYYRQGYEYRRRRLYS